MNRQLQLALVVSLVTGCATISMPLHLDNTEVRQAAGYVTTYQSGTGYGIELAAYRLPAPEMLGGTAYVVWSVDDSRAPVKLGTLDLHLAAEGPRVNGVWKGRVAAIPSSVRVTLERDARVSVPSSRAIFSGAAGDASR